MEQEKIIEEIRTESSNIQTAFIVDLVKLCNKYNIKKTEFIRDTIKELYTFAQASNFDSFVVE